MTVGNDKLPHFYSKAHQSKNTGVLEHLPAPNIEGPENVLEKKSKKNVGLKPCFDWNSQSTRDNFWIPGKPSV